MLSRFRNKYILAACAFAVWMLFFDDRDIITTHFRHRSELNDLERSRAHYQNEIADIKKELHLLKTDPLILEKYAREKYRMKRDNEDVFVFQAEPTR
jgi:cell division protein DivIC